MRLCSTLNYINILQPVYLNIFLHVTFLQCSYFKDDERETLICEISSSFKNTFVEAIEKDVSVALTKSFIDNKDNNYFFHEIFLIITSTQQFVFRTLF